MQRKDHAADGVKAGAVAQAAAEAKATGETKATAEAQAAAEAAAAGQASFAASDTHDAYTIVADSLVHSAAPPLN